MVDLGTLAYLTQWLEKHYCCCCSKGLMVSYSCRNSASGLGIVQRAGIPCRPGPTFGCCRHSSAILRLRAGLEMVAERRAVGMGVFFSASPPLTSGLAWR